MKVILAFFLLFILTACGGKDVSIESTGTYFDIKGYFEKESERLRKQSRTILKSVEQNEQIEKKQIRLENWETELEPFAESDINKPAWRNSYSVKSEGTTTHYISNDKSLKTERISVQKSADGKVESISIRNSTANFLYTSTEDLLYIPDSLYSIKRQQDVLIIGPNSYTVQGNFKTAIQ